METISSINNPPVDFQKNNHNLIEPEQKPERIFVNSRQLSEIIGMPIFTIRQKVREGVFPAYKMTGKGYLFKIVEIVKIIEDSKIELKSNSQRCQNAKATCNGLPIGKGGQ